MNDCAAAAIVAWFLVGAACFAIEWHIRARGWRDADDA